MKSMHLSESTFINTSTIAKITKHGKPVTVPRVASVQEMRAKEIGARPPYMYTSLCPDRRFRK